MVPIRRIFRPRVFLHFAAAAFSAALFLFSCRSTTDLVLDDPAFLKDMVEAALAGEQFVITPEDYRDIQKLMKNEKPDYRRAGVILAVQSGADKLRPYIMDSALDSHPDVSGEAKRAILAEPDLFRPYILESAGSRDAAVRAEALSLVPLLGGTESVAFLIEYFSDPDVRVRESASRAVRSLTDRLNPLLRAALSDSNPLAASVAYRTLGRYGNPEDAAVFSDAFSSVHPEIRREAQLAALALGKSGLENLHNVAADSKRDIRSRIAALDVIEGLRFPESLPLLIGLLDNPDERISGKAESALGTYGDEAVPVLAKLYRESSQINRLYAVRLMKEIASTSALPVLASALGDSSEEIRKTAREALESFGERSLAEVRRVLLGESLLGTQEALNYLRDEGDSWLVTDERGKANSRGIFLLITLSEKEELEVFLEKTRTSRLYSETILSLKQAWRIGEEFAELDAVITGGGDPYLLAWRRREAYAVEAREVLRESFEMMHKYFDSRDPEVLEKAETIRERSLALEDSAEEQKALMESMAPSVRERGLARLKRYRELREELVRIWEYVAPELHSPAESIYKARGLDPEALSKESVLLE